MPKTSTPDIKIYKTWSNYMNNQGGARRKATKTSKGKSSKSKSRSRSNINNPDKRKIPRSSRRKNLADDGYVRPKVTASDTLTGEQIKERLKNYERVYEDDIPDLKVEEKIAYFEVLDDGKFKYKPGGYVLVNGSPDYLVLTTSKGSWSVQLENHIIFRAKKIDEIEERHQREMAERLRNEHHLRKLLIKQKRVIQILRERIDELEEN